MAEEVLRQIEIDVLTNKVPNLKDELLKWVKECQNIVKMLYVCYICINLNIFQDNILLITKHF